MVGIHGSKDATPNPGLGVEMGHQLMLLLRGTPRDFGFGSVQVCRAAWRLLVAAVEISMNLDNPEG